MNDLQAIRRLKAGDPGGLEPLMERYQGLLCRIASRLLGDGDRAADAVQVTWVSAFFRMKGCRAEHLRSWLVRIAVNACYDEIRRANRRREVPLVRVNVNGDEVDAGDWLADPSSDVEARLEAREFEWALNSALKSLAPIYRTMFILVDVEGLNYEEAAHAARLPVRGRSRIRRSGRAE